MRDVDSGQDLTFYDLVLSIVYCFIVMRIESLLWGIEVGTWNKAYCFVYITCTMGSVGEYFGDSQQADRGIHVCRGGGGGAGGNHAESKGPFHLYSLSPQSPQFPQSAGATPLYSLSGQWLLTPSLLLFFSL